MATKSGSAGSAGELHAGLRNSLGPELADNLIDVLAPLERGDLAHRADLLDYRDECLKIREDIVDLKGQVARLDAKVDGVESRLDAKIDQLGARLDAKIDGVESRLETEFGKLVPRFIWSALVFGIGLSGTIFGAVFGALKLT